MMHLIFALLCAAVVSCSAAGPEWKVEVFPLPKPVRAGVNTLLKVEITYGNESLRFQPDWMSGLNLLSMTLISRDFNQFAIIDSDKWRIPESGRYTAETNITFPAAGLWTATFTFFAIGADFDNMMHTYDPIDINVGINTVGRRLPILPSTLKPPRTENSTSCFTYFNRTAGPIMSIPRLSCGANPGVAGVRTTLQIRTKVNGTLSPAKAGDTLTSVPVGVCVGLAFNLMDHLSSKPLTTLRPAYSTQDKMSWKLVRVMAIHELRRSSALVDGIDDKLLATLDSAQLYRPPFGTKVALQACQLPSNDLDEGINDALNTNPALTFGPALSSAFVFPRAGSYRVIALVGASNTTMALGAWFVKAA